MDIQEALAFIEKYNEGTNTYNGHPEWEIRKVIGNEDPKVAEYEVRCYEIEKVGGGTEDIQWTDGFSGRPFRAWYDREPDFKQAYLSEKQVILLAQDLMVEVEGDKEAE